LVLVKTIVSTVVCVRPDVRVDTNHSVVVIGTVITELDTSVVVTVCEMRVVRGCICVEVTVCTRVDNTVRVLVAYKV